MKLKVWSLTLLSAFALSAVSVEAVSAQEKKAVRIVKAKPAQINVDVKKSDGDQKREIRIVVDGEVSPEKIQELVEQAMAGTKAKGKVTKRVVGNKTFLTRPTVKNLHRLETKKLITDGGKNSFQFRVKEGKKPTTAKKFVFRSNDGKKPTDGKTFVFQSKDGKQVKGKGGGTFVFDSKNMAGPKFFIGVETEPLSGQTRNALGLNGKNGGLMVTKIVENSPAAKAGLQKFDIIRLVGKHQVKSPMELVKAVEKIGHNKEDIVVLRNLKPITVEVKPDVRRFKIQGNVEVQDLIQGKIKNLKTKLNKEANVFVEVISDKAKKGGQNIEVVHLDDVVVGVDGLKKELNEEIAEVYKVIQLEASGAKKGEGTPKVITNWNMKHRTGKSDGTGHIVWNERAKKVTSGNNFRWAPRSSHDSALQKINDNLSKMQKDMNRLANRIERLIKVLEK